MLSENGFSYKKATQSLAFFSQKEIDNTLDKLKALKLIYFADRYHGDGVNRQHKPCFFK